MGERLLQWTQPMRETLIGGAVNDVAHSTHALLAEDALLRQQVIVLKRQVKHPELKNRDRLLLVFLASKVELGDKNYYLSNQPPCWAGIETCSGWYGSENQPAHGATRVCQLKRLP